MKKLFLTFSFLTFLGVSYSCAQKNQSSICECLSVAEHYFFANIFSSALDAYQEAYNSECIFYANDYFNAAKSAATINHLLASEFFLEKSFSHGVSYERYLNDSTFFRFPEKLKSKIKSRFPELKAAYYLSLNPSAVEKITSLIAIDQMIRQEDSEATLGIKDLKQEEKYKVWCSVDSVFIFKNLLLFFDEYPDLLPNHIGEKRSDLVLILKHQSYYADKFEKLQPHLSRAVNTGLLKSSELAMLTDSYLIKKNGKQRYGTGWRLNDDDKTELYPLESIKNLDIIRKEVGLISLGLTQVAQMSDSVLPKEYVLSHTIEDFCK